MSLLQETGVLISAQHAAALTPSSQNQTPKTLLQIFTSPPAQTDWRPEPDDASTAETHLQLDLQAHCLFTHTIRVLTQKSQAEKVRDKPVPSRNIVKRVLYSNTSDQPSKVRSKQLVEALVQVVLVPPSLGQAGHTSKRNSTFVQVPRNLPISSSTKDLA